MALEIVAAATQALSALCAMACCGQSLPNCAIVGVDAGKRQTILAKLSTGSSADALESLRKDGLFVAEESGVVLVIDKKSGPFATLERTKSRLAIFDRTSAKAGVVDWADLGATERDLLAPALKLLAGGNVKSFSGAVGLTANPLALIDLGGRIITDVAVGGGPGAAEQERLLKASPARVEKSNEPLASALPPSLDFFLVSRTLPRSAILDLAAQVVQRELEATERNVDLAAKQALARLGAKDGPFGRTSFEQLPSSVQERLITSVSAKPERLGFSNVAEAVAALRRSTVDIGYELGLTYFDGASGGFRIGAIAQVWR